MQSMYEICEYSHPLDIRIFLHKVDSFAMHTGTQLTNFSSYLTENARSRQAR